MCKFFVIFAETDQRLSFMGNREKYPVDRASFKGIREEGLLYVDKTGYIYRMPENKGKFYFLARPRRFGKSMFLDTLAEYF